MARDVGSAPRGQIRRRLRPGSHRTRRRLRLRVVIAEDEALIRLDLREMLREEGFDVVGEAADGEQAVALANELLPDLVICDIKMPKMDGIAAAAQIAGKRDRAGRHAHGVQPARPRSSVPATPARWPTWSSRSRSATCCPAIEMATSRFAEIKALEAEVSGLRERLEARKLIERAKGALMTAHELTEPQAFRWIQRAAMDNRTSMRAVAELVPRPADTDTDRRGRADSDLAGPSMRSEIERTDPPTLAAGSIRLR